MLRRLAYSLWYYFHPPWDTGITPPEVVEAVEGIAVPATFVTSDTPATVEQPAVAPGESAQEIPPAEKPAAAKQATKPSVPVKKAKPKPKSPPATVSLKSPQDTYTLTGAIPVTVDIKIGPDDLVVVADQVKDEMLLTKLLVKTAAGEAIACSKPTPRLSATRPYRVSGRPVDVRNAETLEPDSVITLDMPNLLEYYPITEPGTYTVQFSMQLGVHSRFVGRYQTQIDDLEASIRDISTNPALAQSEKILVVRDMKEEVNQLKLKKDHRYVIAGTRGKPLQLNSNILELVIQ